MPPRNFFYALFVLGKALSGGGGGVSVGAKGFLVSLFGIKQACDIVLT